MSNNEKTESPEIEMPKPSPQRGCQDFGLQTTKRKRGAPKGNHNALKHGIYSNFILLSDESVIEKMRSDGSLQDELALAQACLKSALQSKEAATEATEKIAWDSACHAWFESVVKIKVTAVEKSLQANEVWDSFMEAIQAVNDRQGVK